MKYVLMFAILLFFSSEAFTSDKGIKREIVEGCYKLFCETSIATDIRPLMEALDNASLKDMSTEGFDRFKANQRESWKKIVERHREAIALSGLTNRLTSVEGPYRKQATDEAWIKLKKECRREFDPKARADSILTFLNNAFPPGK
jgi:hypothetical protein